MPVVLYIGRFQPFHKGHLSVIKKLYADYGPDNVIVAIGSSNKSHEYRNPFTFEERKEMLETSLKTEKMKIPEIFPVTDTIEDEAWVENVKEEIGKQFDIVCTGSEWTRQLFEKADICVLKPEFFKQEGKIVSATDIRDRILKGIKWEHLVPNGTISVIGKINGTERIKKVAEKEREHKDWFYKK